MSDTRKAVIIDSLKNIIRENGRHIPPAQVIEVRTGYDQELDHIADKIYEYISNLTPL